MSLLTSPFVPEGMVDLMKKLSKGVIKERPSNIYEYAAVFFEKMLIERDGSLDKGYGKFRSYTEYCKFMDKMDQRRLNQTTKRHDTTDPINVDTTDAPQEETVLPLNIEVQGVAIQGAERKIKDTVKNVSINPKYKSQSEKVMKPVVPSVANVKKKPRKLSSKKPSENLIVIKEEKEETSADVDDSGNGEFSLNKAAAKIQKAFRMYLSNKKSEDGDVTKASGQVSHLSEDAAAFIIQRAFKSLAGKLKSLAQKTKVESNDDIVVPVAGQENDILVDKIINNNDENSEQMLNKPEDANKDMELKENQLNTAYEDTAATENEINENQLADNLMTVSTTDTAMQPIESKDELTLNDPVADEFHKQVISTAGSRKESNTDQEATTTTATQPDINANTNEIEVTLPDQASIELKQNESVDHAITVEIESLGTTESPSKLIELMESQVENVSNEILVTDVSDNPDSHPETETTAEKLRDETTNQLEGEFKLIELTNDTNNKVDNTVINESEQPEITTELRGTESDVDHYLVADSIEKNIPPDVEDSLRQLEIVAEDNSLIEHSSDENIPASEVDSNPKHDIKDDSPADYEIKNVEEKSVEPQSKEQLFLVEKDGIYVNMDVLQEKFGVVAVDDGAGSDSEKTFKLNIQEREEILVNQENFQQITDDKITTDDHGFGKNDLSNTAVDTKNEIDDEMEGTVNNIDIKDEEGNEEYELAETVVLVDIPLKSRSYKENEQMATNDGSAENQLPIITDTLKHETSTLAKKDKSKDETDKLEPIILDENNLKEHTKSMELLDIVSSKNQGIEEMTEIESKTQEILRRENVTDEVETNIGKVEDLNEAKVVEYLNEAEVFLATSERESISEDHHAQTNNENVTEKLNEKKETDSKSETILKEKIMEETKEKENVENHQVKIEEALATSSTEEILKEETRIEEVDNVHENIESQVDKKEGTDTTGSSDDLMKENVVETENELNKIEEKNATSNSEDILQDESVIKEGETKCEDDDNKLNGNSDSQMISDSGNVSNEENAIEEVETKQEHEEKSGKVSDTTVDDQTNDPRSTAEDFTKTENHLNEGHEEEKIHSKREQEESENQEIEPAEETELSRNEDATVIVEDDEKRTDQLEIGENEKLVKAATIIQKVFRGYAVRNSTQNKTKNDSNQLDHSAALTIQKYVRGYLVRRHMQQSKNPSIVRVSSNQIKDDENEANKTDQNSNNEVAPQLPAYSNRFLIPKDSFLERESFADDEDYTTTCKELAATSIQKSYRGYRVRRSLKSETDTETDVITSEGEVESSVGNQDQIETAVNEAERVISDVLNVAADVLPPETYESDFEDEGTDEKNVETSDDQAGLNEPPVKVESVLGQIVHDNIHVEGQMQQKFNQMSFQDSAINPIEEMSDSSEQPETPRVTVKTATQDFESLDGKFDGSKSFSYEQLSSDLSDTEENKRESLKESEVDETSRDERDDLSEVENFDLSSCGEDSLEAMYYSIRKNEIMLDRMQKQVAEQRESKGDEVEENTPENIKVEFPERVTENLDVAMQEVFKSLESSSDCDAGKKDEDDNSSTLDLGLDDSSSVNDEKEIETSRHIKQEINSYDIEQSESTSDTHAKDDEVISQSSETNFVGDAEMKNVDQSQQSDSSFNSSTRFIMKSQSVSEDMMNPIMFAMKRKQALLDQMHVRPYALQENLSEDHDAFPEHLLSDIDIGNIQRKIFASSVSETDSDYIEPNVTSRRLVRDDFNISTALDHLSTDSDSTIVSAATKIQAGARGFLTRRRLRRSSGGGTSISFEKRYSFGNAAIDKSLEDLIKRQEQINLDGAALKIQQQYRRYQARKNNLKKVSPIREQTLELSGGSSVDDADDNIGIKEITLAQKKVDDEQNVVETKETHPIRLNIDEVDTVKPVKRTPVNQRRLTLQRGDAVQRNSRPDSQDQNHTSTDNQNNEPFKDSETGEYTGSINKKPERKGE